MSEQPDASEIADLSPSENSTSLERIVETVMLGDLCQEAWYGRKQIIDIMHSSVNAFGHDAVLECASVSTWHFRDERRFVSDAIQRNLLLISRGKIARVSECKVTRHRRGTRTTTSSSWRTPTACSAIAPAPTQRQDTTRPPQRPHPSPPSIVHDGPPALGINTH